MLNKKTTLQTAEMLADTAMDENLKKNMVQVLMNI